MRRTSEDGRKSGPLDRFLSAFSLASRLPVRVPFVWDSSRLDFHLPLVGVPVAFLAAACAAAAGALGLPSVFSALICLGVQYFAFNLFHLDGLMDSADALLGAADREKRLAILKDSRIGVFAFFAGFLDLALKAALLERAAGAAAGPFTAALLFCYPVAGRAAAALVPAFAPPARSDGLGARAAGARPLRVLGGALIAFAAIAGTGAGIEILAAGTFPAAASAGTATAAALLAASAAASALFMARAYRKGVGGYTGDAQGAAVEFGEAAYLASILAAAAL